MKTPKPTEYQKVMLRRALSLGLTGHWDGRGGIVVQGGISNRPLRVYRIEDLEELTK